LVELNLKHDLHCFCAHVLVHYDPTLGLRALTRFDCTLCAQSCLQTTQFACVFVCLHLPGLYDDNYNYYYEKWFSSLDRGCAQMLYFRFEIIGGVRSNLLLFFFGRKNMLKKKAVSPRSHPASLYIHTHVYFVHIYEYIYAEM